MNRRDFLRRTSMLGIGATAPSLFGVPGFINQASAMPILDSADYRLPGIMPQVINVFLYGGPSELAGNLSNMDRINRNSQNPYPQQLRQMQADGGQVTDHGFWANAGGNAMEDMLAAGDLSVYRTIHRRKNNTQSHRPSVFSSLKGSLAIDAAPGMGSTIAALLNANKDALNGSVQLRGKGLNQLVLPFISFEGSSTAFVRDPDGNLPLQLRGLSLDEQFDNPYSRGRDDHSIELEALIARVVDNAQRIRYNKVAEGFELRRTMEQLIGELQSAAEQDDADHPVELPRRLVGAVVEDPCHVQEYGKHHEVSTPPVHVSDQLPECNVGGQRLDVQVCLWRCRPIVEHQEDARDRQQDE